MTKHTLALVNYGLGNIGSVFNMFRHIGATVSICQDPTQLPKADAIVLPGVGRFDAGMTRLLETGFADAIVSAATSGKPVLGICLGMQLLCDSSEEGDLPGLGLIPGKAVHFDRTRFSSKLPIPHMGWATVEPKNELAEAIVSRLPARSRFYFVHSYHVECRDAHDVLLTAHHGYDFAAAIGRNNALGFQFHPEKSLRYGMAILRAWLDDIHA